MAAIAAYTGNEQNNKTAWGPDMKLKLLAAGLFASLISLVILILENKYLNNSYLISPSLFLLLMNIAFGILYCLSLWVLSCIGLSAMRGTGNVVRPMIYSLLGMVINAILTPFLAYSSRKSGIHLYSKILASKALL